MKRIGNILTLILVMASSSLYGQYLGFERIEDTDVRKWIPKFEFEYYGAYHFGDSEAESTLVLFPAGEEIIGQVQSGTWNDDASAWLNIYDNLSNVRIDAQGRFRSDQYNGRFVFYENGGERQRCLKIYDSWTGVASKKGEYEVGCKDDAATDYMFPGKYAHASTRPLSTDELQQRSQYELKLMRNEIFARYGYRFRSGGEMDTYFRQQKWYRPQHADVKQFLTSLEKSNIKLIQAAERK